MQRCYPSQQMTILTYYFLLIFKFIALKTLSIQGNINFLSEDCSSYKISKIYT